MMSALIEKLLFSKTQKEAEESITLIEEVYDFPQRHIGKLKDFALNNDVIAKSNLLVSKINSILDRYNLSHLGTDDKVIEINDDDLPF